MVTVSLRTFVADGVGTAKAPVTMRKKVMRNFILRMRQTAEVHSWYDEVTMIGIRPYLKSFQVAVSDDNHPGNLD